MPVGFHRHEPLSRTQNQLSLKLLPWLLVSHTERVPLFFYKTDLSLAISYKIGKIIQNTVFSFLVFRKFGFSFDH